MELLIDPKIPKDGKYKVHVTREFITVFDVTRIFVKVLLVECKLRELVESDVR